ncbi:MAG: hypothetical protein P1R58_07885 [bacterium]|nr:hypothetical protein [bacterium]
MDISQEVLIEVALTLIGYLASGALAIMIYRMVTRPKANNQTQESVRTAARRTEEPLSETQLEPDRLANSAEFINFGAPSPSAPKLLSSSKIDYAVSRAARRDRADIIRIAREMMKAGATTEKIKGVIPISESELALLRIGNKN